MPPPPRHTGAGKLAPTTSHRNRANVEAAVATASRTPYLDRFAPPLLGPRRGTLPTRYPTDAKAAEATVTATHEMIGEPSASTRSAAAASSQATPNSTSTSVFTNTREKFVLALSPGDKTIYQNTTSAAEFRKRCPPREGEEKTTKRLESVAKQVEAYAKALDVVEDSDSDRACGLWGALGVVVAAAADSPYAIRLISQLAMLSDNLSRLGLYSRLYPPTSSLQHALTNAFVQTIDICSAAYCVFSPDTASSGHNEEHQGKCEGIETRWATFEDKCGDIVDAMRTLIEALDKATTVSADEKDEGEDMVAPLRTAEAKAEKGEKDGDRIENALTDSEKEEVLEWLLAGTGNPTLNHQTAVKLRYPGTGEWLLHSKEYMEWLRTQHAILWLHGIPGSGKTVLCSTVIEDVNRKLRPNGSGVVYFYCSHNDGSLQGAIHILRSLISQLCHQSEHFFAEVQAAFRRLHPHELSVAQAINIIRTNSWHFTKIIVAVDALDECPNYEDTIMSLVQLIDRQSGNVNLFFTSRQEERIQQLMNQHAQYDVPISKTGVQKDINNFVWSQLQERVAERKLKLRDPTLLGVIRHSLVDGADGMFLWAICQIDNICRLRNDKSICNALAKLPRDLDQTYIRILEEIRQQGPEEKKLARRILRWLVHSRVALHPQELAELIAVEPKDSALDCSAVITDPEDLLDACGPLIRTTRDESGVERIQLAHHTIHEFLVSDRILNSTIPEFHMAGPESHMILTTICARYLNFTDFSTRCKNDDELHKRLSSYHALGYAAAHWHEHLYHCDPTVVPTLLPVLNWFVNQREDNYTSWLQASAVSTTSFAENTPPLYFSVLYSLFPLTAHLLDRGDNPNARTTSTDGDCALHVAAFNNDLATIKLLASKGADVEARAWNREQTPLHYAAEAGNADAVALLLDLGADVDSRSHSQSTPLYRAARGGDIRTVTELLKRGADVNAKTWDGWTPAHEAARSGDKEVWEALLAANADMEAETSNGQKPGDVAIAWTPPLLEVINKYGCAYPGCKLAFPSKAEKALHEQATHLSALPTYSPPPVVQSSSSSPSPSPLSPAPLAQPSSSKLPVRSSSSASKSANRHRPSPSVTPLPAPIKHNDLVTPWHASLPRPATQYFWCSAASCSHLFDTMASRDLHESTAHAGLTVTFKHQPGPVVPPAAAVRPSPPARSGTSKSAPPSQSFSRSLSDERLSGKTSEHSRNNSIATTASTGMKSSTATSTNTTPTKSGVSMTKPGSKGRTHNNDEAVEICGIVGCVQRFTGIAELMRHEVNSHQEALKDLEREGDGCSDEDVARFASSASVIYSCRSLGCRKPFQLAASRMWHEMLTHPNEELVKRNERLAHSTHYGTDKVWTDMFNGWKKTHGMLKD